MYSSSPLCQVIFHIQEKVQSLSCRGLPRYHVSPLLLSSSAEMEVKWRNYKWQRQALFKDDLSWSFNNQPTQFFIVSTLRHSGRRNNLHKSWWEEQRLPEGSVRRAHYQSWVMCTRLKHKLLFCKQALLIGIPFIYLFRSRWHPLKMLCRTWHTKQVFSSEHIFSNQLPAIHH